jgi:hypothetical protein
MPRWYVRSGKKVADASGSRTVDGDVKGRSGLLIGDNWIPCVGCDEAVIGRPPTVDVVRDSVLIMWLLLPLLLPVVLVTLPCDDGERENVLTYGPLGDDDDGMDSVAGFCSGMTKK